ncbi:MAG: hypothetical protein M0R06_16710 [Sphaerochaeta sp.]|nr:hypothetical protein [Sphaerochaeta sp.]
MILKLKTAPTVEPVSLLEIKNHLRIDSGSFADTVTSIQSIAPGSYENKADYALKGDGVEALGYHVVALLSSNANGEGGTVDVKLQEADEDLDAAYVDVAGGAFDQITEENDGATYELEYTGTKRYIRAVATVAGVACTFGVSILKGAPAPIEDDLLEDWITAAREWAEDYHGYAYITQTWQLFLEQWPLDNYIDLPMPPLQSVTHLKYTDKDGDTTEWDSDNYIVNTDREPGRLTLAYGKAWPTGVVLSPDLPIEIEYIAGYGDTAAGVPKRVKSAIKLLVGMLYRNRGDVDFDDAANVNMRAVKSLLSDRSYSRRWSNG